MEDQSKFYEWLVKIGNIHTADNKRMSRAYEVIALSNAKVGNVKTQK